MRFLPERPDHDGESPAGQKSASYRCPDPREHGENAVPLYDLLPRSTCDQARGKGYSECWVWLEQGGCSMSGANVSPTGRNDKEMSTIPKHVEEALDRLTVTTSRRNFLKSSGLLV